MRRLHDGGLLVNVTTVITSTDRAVGEINRRLQERAVVHRGSRGAGNCSWARLLAGSLGVGKVWSTLHPGVHSESRAVRKPVEGFFEFAHEVVPGLLVLAKNLGVEILLIFNS